MNRKRLPKRQSVTPEIYQVLIQTAENPSYTLVRLKIAFCLLTVNGNWNSNQRTLTVESPSASNITRILLDWNQPFQTRIC